MERWKERVYATYTDTAPTSDLASATPGHERRQYLRRYRVIRWTCWQPVRAGLLFARGAEGADWQRRVLTQDLVFVAGTPAHAPAA
jgi:hypothetical protein